ncbi:xanthine dehydrogenase family protein molybdopterin-binding subunit [Acidipila sp. EB88]|nr:xanthine dehydrogenase family protein molybdopterin-binding subunit [Acidipila sp. EB88]
MANPAPGTPAAILGSAVPRIDGPLKTSGVARYSADFNLPRMVYAVPVVATIGSGRITSLDATQAEGMRGVLKVYRHGNMPRLYKSNPASRTAQVGETRPPMDDETIYYNGQYVAVVVAETMDQARAAAGAVKVRYATTPLNISRDLSDGFTDKMEVKSKRGDVDQGFSAGTVTVDETYITPIETHNPIEMHAVVADWDGRNFTLYESTQGVANAKEAMADMLGVPQENMRVVMQFLGSGFGGKLFPWTHTPIAAAAARDLNRPVKLVVDRHMMFTNVGHRPRTVQRVRLAATSAGKLTSISHDYASDSSLLDEKGENCGEATPLLWSTPNLRVRASVVRRNLGTPTPMRGPGAVPGLYATESAMNELAIKLRMDPVQLRLLNEPELDESTGKPFSSRHLKECLTTGAEKFGWSRYNPEVGSMKKGDLTIGWGVAAASWIAGRSGTDTHVSMNDDGTVRVVCGTQDIGTGTYTIFAQVVHARTGVPMDRIKVVLGDTRLPSGPMSGGSMVTGSVLPSIDEAAREAMGQLLKIATSGNPAPFPGAKVDDLALTDGYVHLKSGAPASGVRFEKILQDANVRATGGKGSTQSSFESDAAKKFSFHSFGAHFVEVEYDPGIARLRVSRVVSVIDVGKVINARAARNQIEGAVVMGVGMALFEETQYDARTARPTNNNLADYIISSNPDTPEMDVVFLDYPDTNLSSFGARGVGEIGLAGVAPAITAAIYQATGVRKRELPVRIEDLLHPAPALHSI